MIDGLDGVPRLILKAKLSPTVGSAFQPTGFPDLGPAEFERPDANGESTPALLVESVQSLANHLESTTWNAHEDRPVQQLERLPYIEVRDDGGRFLTSSRLEPHRLAGAYVRNAQLDGAAVNTWMIERLGVQKGAPVNWRAVYRGLFELDPLCLVHGVFLSDKQWANYGNPRVRRALTAVLEAYGTRPVVSGGVKRDDVNPTVGEGRGASEGYGFVPFGRTEYAAASIELGVAVDVEQIRGYGLGDAETELLLAVALWEVRILLGGPLRLRTACDLEVDALEAARPDGWELPSADELSALIAKSPVEFERPGARTVTSA